MLNKIDYIKHCDYAHKRAMSCSGEFVTVSNVYNTTHSCNICGFNININSVSDQSEPPLYINPRDIDRIPATFFDGLTT